MRWLDYIKIKNGGESLTDSVKKIPKMEYLLKGGISNRKPKIRQFSLLKHYFNHLKCK
ncbi:hypothetical protein J14TS2_00220 [Bacillus sp. J14TS2]|nr:hypothetical protein J14TS2_00220 [Bacillus sp. J14TS2]